MTDLLPDYGPKSLARFLDVSVPDIDAAYVITPTFNYDRKPDPTNPANQTVPRPLPFAAVELVNDEKLPWSVGNILYESELNCFMRVHASTHTELMQITAACKQAVLSGANAITGSPGVTLYNFALASGTYYANAGTLQVEFSPTQYFGPDSEQQEEAMKHRSITPIVLSAYRDNLATLLENKGRVNLTDT